MCISCTLVAKAVCSKEVERFLHWGEINTLNVADVLELEQRKKHGMVYS